MADGSTVHSEAEIAAADEALFGWVKRWPGSLAVGVMLVRDEDSPVPAVTPHPIAVGSMEGLTEAEIAAMLAQADAAVLLVLRELAVRSEMGEARFREVFLDVQRRLLGDEGLGVCDECGG